MEHKMIDFHAYQGKAWIAKIIGPHPKFKLDRQFINGKRDVTIAKSNIYRDIEIPLPLEEGAIYEWSCQESSRRNERGFWKIVDDECVNIAYEDVIKEVC